MRRVKGTLAALAFLLALGLSGCNLLEPELADTGMVKKLEIEGGLCGPCSGPVEEAR